MKTLRYILLLFALIVFGEAQATHNRAGEITYEQISNYTYRIRMVTYTFTSSEADRDSLKVSWGDNTISYVRRMSKTELPDFYYRNVYIGEHTFPGPGFFEIFMLDQNRNKGVQNIDDSVNIPFAIKTQLYINPDLGFNTTPILLSEPVDKASVGRVFIHNPAAYDVDGDSISYRLATCLGNEGEPIPDYEFPESSNRPIYIDAVTGDLVWDSPTKTGIFNIAFYVEEWRRGVKIGQVLRDMQIEVIETENMPPVISDLPSYCVPAGDFLTFPVLATDADRDLHNLRSYGGPYQVPTSPATFSVTENGRERKVGTFEWFTHCDHVRLEPYQVEFKVLDDLRLVDFKDTKITVIAPAPEFEDEFETTNSAIELKWKQPECVTGNMVGYRVYRKLGESDFEPADCETGIPAGSGFVPVAEIEDPYTTSYLDNDGGNGLKQGHWYCYRIVTLYSDGAESIASEEKCARLVQGVPVMTNVDVKETDTSEGKIWVAWVKPNEFDPEEYPGPYKYVVSRSEGIWGTNFQEIKTLEGIDNTEFTDVNINTVDTAYSYKVEFYSGSQLVAPPQVASSTFIRPLPVYNMSVRIEVNVPWINESFEIYRKLEGEADFPEEPIGVSQTTVYDDRDVEPEMTYCYYAKGNGYYTVDGIKSPIINNSQENCAQFVDRLPPCPPILSVDSDCENGLNSISWEVPDEVCNDDVTQFILSYASTLEDEPEVIETFDADRRNFTHYLQKTLAGCYYIVAVDDNDNVSEKSIKQCIDKCSKYDLPNVFSPDGDGVNDFFTPVKPYYSVDKIEMKIFTRWGKLVFETTNPDIEWDGKEMTTGRLVSDGVYYYTCTVYEKRLSGIEDRHLTGFVHVITGDKTVPTNN